jgi:hypothetical protein
LELAQWANRTFRYAKLLPSCPDKSSIVHGVKHLATPGPEHPFAAKVKEYATWSLIVTCRPCNAPRTVPLADLPPELTIMQAIMRMRCRTCCGRAEAAALDDNVSAG